MRGTLVGLTIGIILIHGVAAQTPAKPEAVMIASQMPSDSEIRTILAERIDRDKQSVGIVVGVIEPAGRRVVAYGALDKGDTRPLNGQTVFEIGSMTKVFTSLLLADMVQKGEVALTDPVVEYLPSGVKMPERGGKQITLEDLATHTSGLPRLPDNFKPKDPANPYADYSVEQMYQFLSSYQLTRDIESKYEYSNLGGGLLGHVLARRAGMDYEQLVQTRILGPLGMKSTGITFTASMKARLAVGHNPALTPVANWDLPTLAGAGALRSTADDMLDFLAANLGYTKTPLGPAMAAQIASRRPTGSPGLQIALGWHVLTSHGHEIVWHNGGTGGYRSYMAYDLKRRIGVVLLSNTSTTVGVDDIGLHLMEGGAPLAEMPKQRTEVAVDPKLLAEYVGTYQLAPTFAIAITLEDGKLSAQATGQPKFPIFAESPAKFFLKVVDAQIEFSRDGTGAVTSLTLYQNGNAAKGKRTDGPAII
jgi:serine-type D-Ala-D-Ala carboxypeptidase/endopeptidase